MPPRRRSGPRRLGQSGSRARRAGPRHDRMAPWSCARRCGGAAWCDGSTPTGPVAPTVRRGGAVCRAAGSQRRLQPGLGLRRPRVAPPTGRPSGRRRPDAGAPRDAWLRGVSAAPVLVLCLSHPDAYLDRYAEPDKGWTDRDPGSLAGPLLGRRHRHRGGATCCSPRSTRASARSSSACRPSGSTRCGGPTAYRPDRHLVGVVALGHELARVEGSARRPATAAGGPGRPPWALRHRARAAEPTTGPAASRGRGPSSGGTRLGRFPAAGGDDREEMHPRYGPQDPTRTGRRDLRRADRRHRRRGGDAGGVPRVRLLRHLLPRPARRPRRAQAGAATDPLLDGRDGPAPRPRPREVRAASSATSWASTTRTATRRSTTPSSGWPSPSRCACRSSTGTATSARSTTARRPRATPRPGWPPAALLMTSSLDEDTVDFIPNYDDQLLQPEVLPVGLPQPARQRRQRDRGGHGHQHGAAQPRRGHRGGPPPHRQPHLLARRPDAVRARAPTCPRAGGSSGSTASATPTSPAAAASAPAPRRGSRRPRRAGWASSSPSCPTSSAPRRSSRRSRTPSSPRSSRASRTSRTSPTASTGCASSSRSRTASTPTPSSSSSTS